MAQTGEEITFEYIYHTCRDGMMRYAQTLTNGDRALAEDILQYAFMDIARNIRRLRTLDEVQVKVYLLRAVQTWARRLMKQERKQQEVIRQWEEKYRSAQTAEGDDLLDRLCTREQMNTIRATLRSMPEEYRTILTSYYLLGESLRTVAQRMQLPYTTVQKRCQRGTHLLVEQLQRKVKKGEL